MKKLVLFFTIFLSFALFTKAQELKCNVQILSQQIPGSNKQVFQTMQNAVYEFMNNRIWTNHAYENQERIECNILINLTEQPSADEFRGTLQIQSRRPVFNSSYNTVMLNYLDNNLQFNYIEFEPLEFNESSHLSNLTSVLAYYAYIILGFDYDSYSFEGGTEYFQKAEVIVNNAQNAPEKGWKAFDAKSNKNRYWLVKNILDKNYAPLREFMYRYHRNGLDLLDSKINEGRANIAESLKLLQTVFRNKPDPFMYYLQVIFDAKSDEFVNIFSEAFAEEKSRVVVILKEINPSNSTKYDKIIKNN